MPESAQCNLHVFMKLKKFEEAPHEFPAVKEIVYFINFQFTDTHQHKNIITHRDFESCTLLSKHQIIKLEAVKNSGDTATSA